MSYKIKNGCFNATEFGKEYYFYKALLFGALIAIWLYGGHQLITIYSSDYASHEELEAWEHGILVLLSTVFAFYLLKYEVKNVMNRNLSQQILKNSKNEFNLLLGSLEEGVWSANFDGSRYYYLNTSIGKIYGRPVKDFYEKRDLWLEVVHPDDRIHVKYDSEILFKRGKVSSEYRIIRPDGKTRWISDRKIARCNKHGQVEKIEGIVTDITERKQAELIVFKERQRANIYLDLVDVMIVALDTDGKIQRLNRKGYEIIGHDYGSLTNAIWFDICLPEDEREDVRGVFSEIAIGKLQIAKKHDNKILRKDGTLRLIAWNSTFLYNEKGSVSSVISSGLDITDEREFELERERLSEELNQAQKMEAVGRLTGGIVHDFNNILASILGYTGLAIDRYAEDSPEKLVGYLKEVRTAGERARDLVAQLLSFSRGGTGFEPQNLQLAPLIKEVVKMLRAPMTPQVQVNLNFESEVPDVFVDPVQVYQAIVNLCINAYDAIDGRGVIDIVLRNKSLDSKMCTTCHKQMAGEWVEVSIADNGEGIQEKNLDKIFESFFTTKEKGKGNGIGLAMTRAIMEQHGGHVLVDSEYGSGSSFQLFFPVVKNNNDDESEDGINEFQKHKPSFSSGNILVIDDEHSLSAYINELLTFYGYTVCSMHDSVEALVAFKNAPDKYDLIISDQTMPKMTGAELLCEILSIRPRLPVILYSGYSENMNKERAKSLGISAFLSKPLDLDRFVHSVCVLVSRQYNQEIDD